MLPLFTLLAIQEAPLVPPAPTALTVVVIVAAPEMLPILTPERPPDAPPELPQAVRVVIDAAIDSGDPQAVAAVVKFAKQTNPDTAAQIDTINTAYLARIAARAARDAAERRAAIASAGPLDFWKGSIEVGASRATGNSETLGLYGSVALEREGIDWQHRLNGRIDYQRTNDTTTARRALAAYQPRYKVGERLYAYGLAQYETDRLLGYDTRLSAGAGVGYKVLAGPDLRLDVEGGPAVRHTDFTTEPAATTLASRASLALRWTITPTLNLSQDAALYLERGSSNAVATTAVDTKLIGALKARLSYNVQYERDAPPGRDPLDTLSRATLVYSF